MYGQVHWGGDGDGDGDGDRGVDGDGAGTGTGTKTGMGVWDRDRDGDGTGKWNGCEGFSTIKISFYSDNNLELHPQLLVCPLTKSHHVPPLLLLTEYRQYFISFPGVL